MTTMPAPVPSEPAGARWRRRAVTIPATFALAGLIAAALPVGIPLLALFDLARGSRFAALRSLLVMAWVVACEAAGLVASGVLWLLRPLAGPRWAAWNFRLQCAWARALFAGAERVFGLRVVVTGAEAIDRGPLLVFMRHASVVDTLLPAVLLSSRTGLRLRYVMKRELLWDPCLDVVGQRLPNAFVRRGSGDAAEVERVRELARDLGPDEGVLLYPEGTRWTPARRAQVLDRLARSADPKLLERALALQWLLPPRLGGVLALLDAAPEADVLVCAHTGLEGVRTLGDLWSGALVGRRIEVEFRRIPARDVPRGREARVEWIYDLWADLDAWLERRAEPDPDRSLA